MQEFLRTACLKEGIELTDPQLEAFDRYQKLLVEWNEKMNLTAITDEKGIAVKHFLDSLAGHQEIRKRLLEKEKVTLVDVGCGAGFPGLPLKILFPSLKVTLLDSLQKRIRFLEEVIAQLGLKGIQAVHERAEEGAHKEEFREKYDFATARAVAPLPILMEYCAGYIAPGGKFLAYKGPSLQEEMQNSQKAMKVLHLSYEKTIPSFGMEEMEHYVGVFRKTGPIALQYPRKQSKIKTTPLGIVPPVNNATKSTGEIPK